MSSFSQKSLKRNHINRGKRTWILIRNTWRTLKGQGHEIFCFWFFYESVSPQPPQSVPLGPFRIFPKIRGDIRKSRAWGKMIHEKNQKSKISWQCPFKRVKIVYTYTYTLYIVVNKKLRYPTLPPYQPHVTALLVSPREEYPNFRSLGAQKATGGSEH
jgi:hypothetical protein